MDDATLDVSLTHIDGFERVALRGELDYTTVTANAEVLEQLMSLRRNVVLDLAGLSFLDSAGLRLLLKIATGHEGPVTLEAVQPSVRQVLKLSGVSEFFDITER
jgi:anti-anti-sigma factor